MRRVGAAARSGTASRPPSARSSASSAAPIGRCSSISAPSPTARSATDCWRRRRRPTSPPPADACGRFPAIREVLGGAAERGVPGRWPPRAAARRSTSRSRRRRSASCSRCASAATRCRGASRRPTSSWRRRGVSAPRRRVSRGRGLGPGIAAARGRGHEAIGFGASVPAALLRAAGAASGRRALARARRVVTPAEGRNGAGERLRRPGGGTGRSADSRDDGSGPHRGAAGGPVARPPRKSVRNNAR